MAFQAFCIYIEIHIVNSSAWIKKYLLHNVQKIAYPSVECKNMTCLNDLLVLHVDRNFRAANPKYWAHSYVHWKFNKYTWFQQFHIIRIMSYLYIVPSSQIISQLGKFELESLNFPSIYLFSFFMLTDSDCLKSATQS